MSTILEALGTAAANNGFVAARPSGLVLEVQRLGAVYKWNGRKFQQWAPNLFDLTADDWQAGPLESTLEVLKGLSRE